MRIPEDTKQRIKRMKKEFSKEPNIKVFENDEHYDQLIIQSGIPFMANCEHHRIAFTGIAHIGYLPNSKLVGLSKMARIVELYLNPTIYTLQERATEQIANYFMEKVKPEGVMVVLEGVHACISYRGVKKPSKTITSAIRGKFRTDEGLKSEFLRLIDKG